MNVDLAFKGFLRLLKAGVRGGKYLNRKWTGKRWDYEYLGQKKKNAYDNSTPNLFSESGLANKTSVTPLGQDKPVTLSQESRALASSATQQPLFGKKKVEAKPKPNPFSLIQEEKTSGEKKNAANANQGGLFGKKTDGETFTKKDFKPELKLVGNETVSSLVTNVKSY